MSDGIRQAVVLAGGLGTRLGALTADTPKPLLPVGGRPFLEWVVANLVRNGIEEIILAIGYRAEAFDAWRTGRIQAGALDALGHAPDPTSPAIRTFVEQEPLGTGGALPLVREWLDPAFFVLNGDTLFDAPLRALAGLLVGASALGAIALRSVSDVARYGEVRLADDGGPDGAGGRISSFAEKGRSGPGLINGGVYALRREVVDGVASPSSLEQDLLPALATHGALMGLPSEGFFIDIGVPETFRTAQQSVPRWWKDSRG